MAATAYAAAVTLLNTMDQIKTHPFLSTYFNNYSIESLREKVDVFVGFVEKYADAESEEAEYLLRRIADVAHEADEIINVEASHRILTSSPTKRSIMSAKMKKITEAMDCVKEKAIKAKDGNYSYAEDLVRRMAAIALEDEDIFKFQAAAEKSRTMSRKLQREKVVKANEKTGFRNQQPTYSSVPSSSSSSSSSTAPPATANTTTMVGFDGYLEQLLDQLTGCHSGRQILPIVGMGGIGKTTLATNVYQYSLMLHHFDIRVWITVSQEFTARNIILQALSCLGGSNSKTDRSEPDDKLGEELYKVLSGRRYLIVLDDIWSVEAWEKIMFFFPENNNRSRIVVTTRESELVDYFGSSALSVGFLNEKNSWGLFCEKAFAKRGCPHPELEEIGKKIVGKCKGLPLTITVFGGLLRKSPRTREYWEIIAKDKSLILESGEGNITPLSMLYSSYKHLPIWLKPCFLYLGLFPEDHEIKVSDLIKLWVAEGLIRSKREQSLEEIAESYAEELVDRNLLLVGELRKNKNLKSCRVHDIVRELCLRIGEKEKYFCVQRDIYGTYHYIVDEATVKLFYPRESQKMSPSIVHPRILEGQRAAPFKSRLLRILFPGNYLCCLSNHVNLRFLFCGYFDSKSHSSIQLFWSLQTLIGRYSSDAPCEIWNMPQLRHIEILSVSLPDPPSPTCEDDVIVLHNLMTLKHVENLVLSKEVCKRIPNIKELEISYKVNEARKAISCYHLQNLGCFNKLESLKLCDECPGGDSLQKLKLPSSLKELRLYGWKLVWSDMAMIATLPHLQFLKFEGNTVVIPKWDFVEGEFLSLKHLQVDDCDDLINWSTADSSSFPELETLSLKDLSEMEEISSEIGDIPTLERIVVSRCSESVIMSAIKILEEQESLGNQNLQLTLNFWDEDKAVMWRGKIQQMGITYQNIHIYVKGKLQPTGIQFVLSFTTVKML